jgi:PAS domain S-box-containing protein
MYDSGHFTILSDSRRSKELPTATLERGNGILLCAGEFAENDGPVITNASNHFLEMTKRSLDQVQGCPLAQLFSPPWTYEVTSRLREHLVNHGVARQKCDIITNDGKRLELELELVQLLGRAVEQPILHVVVRDAAERQNMSRRIAGLLSSFEAIQSEIRMGIWIVDGTDGWVTRCSPELLDIFGLSPEQAMGNDEALLSCIHPDERNNVVSTLSSAVFERQEVELQHRIVLKDNSVRWVKVHTIPLEGPLSSSYRLVGVVFDITKRVLADASLRDAEQRYRTAADVSGDALALFRAIRNDERVIIDFELTDVNQRTIELLSDNARTLVGTKLSHHLSPTLAAKHVTRFAGIVETRIPDETTLHTPSQLFRTDWIHLRLAPHGDGLAVAIRDVSAEKRLEQQLARAQRLESIGRMATGIAHDFNNMLSAINGFTTIARDDIPHDNPACGDLEQVLVAANRASQLTRYLLAFASRQPLCPDLVQINTVLSTLTQILSRLLGNDIQLELVLDPKVVGAWLDSSQLEQAIVNLATNARDAMPQGGTLRVATQIVSNTPSQPRDANDLRNAEYVCITVSDTGIGMDDRTRDQVFEPFFTTKGPTKGTGLGLAMVYGFVKQSGGEITLESTLGQGTQFHIYLPHRKGTRKTDSSIPPPQSGVIEEGVGTLLLVDCDESVRLVAHRILKLHGYHVIEAANAGEAYFILEDTEREIDLLLMSPHLPRVSAVDFVARAKRSHPSIAVIAMSGAVTQEVLNAFIEATDALFIPKPLTPAQLLRTVQLALKGRNQRASGVVRSMPQTNLGSKPFLQHTRTVSKNQQ